jgi:hypothetical protein
MSDFPNYSFADELASPADLGIYRDGSFNAISRAVAGVNYYSDTVGFGQATGLAAQNGLKQNPLGIRFFSKTGLVCSNGANMYEYIDTIPSGMISETVKKQLEKNGLPPGLRGLAPGILEDTTRALNPMGLVSAVAATGYPKCKKVTMPVGDFNGNVSARFDPKNVWIPDPYVTKGGKPQQTRWVLDKWLTKEEYEADVKSESPDAQKERGRQEGFDGAGATTLSLKTSQLGAAILLGTLAVAVLLHTR